MLLAFGVGVHLLLRDCIASTINDISITDDTTLATTPLNDDIKNSEVRLPRYDS
jgi:hypothetical protein